MTDNRRRASRSPDPWGHAYVLLVCTVTTFVPLVNSVAFATENGASVYPVGVETVLPALTPHQGGTMLYEYSAFYEANEVVNSAGAAVPEEFKLRVVANAFRIVHNWKLQVLGGTVNSAIAVPLVYEDLHIIPGKFGKFSISNVDVGVFQVAYAHKDLHWYVGGDVWLPGAAYSPNDILNVGQHNFATGPVGAVTYLPKRGNWEASSKFQYIVNFNDVTTRYRSGNEFTWEYAGMRQINHKIAVGANGFVYRQTTDDLQNGVIVDGGNRGRDVAIGPEVRFHLGAHGGFALKYLPDTLVQNKPRGNAFWFQLGFPVHAGE
jgi:hypothetical protein